MRERDDRHSARLIFPLPRDQLDQGPDAYQFFDGSDRETTGVRRETKPNLGGFTRDRGCAISNPEGIRAEFR